MLDHTATCHALNFCNSMQYLSITDVSLVLSSCPALCSKLPLNPLGDSSSAEPSCMHGGQDVDDKPELHVTLGHALHSSVHIVGVDHLESDSQAAEGQQIAEHVQRSPACLCHRFT